ncbi:MAG: flavin reductase [Candidatus Heimdallarchaeota archaeon]|nr:flavin reductase [Candidatus Heimdallarchaeota archaeon]
MVFVEITPKDLTENAINLIGLDWMLINSGSKEKYNMMTASWGGLGVLWHKPVCFIFVRPSRYTYQFIEEKETFSLNFFNQEYRSILNFCGSKSGRDVDKMKEVNLSPLEILNTPYFKEARLVLICKKIYYQDFNSENFLHTFGEKFYKNGDYHRMYIGEILTCLKQE